MYQSFPIPFFVTAGISRLGSDICLTVVLTEVAHLVSVLTYLAMLLEWVCGAHIHAYTSLVMLHYINCGDCTQLSVQQESQTYCSIGVLATKLPGPHSVCDWHQDVTHSLQGKCLLTLSYGWALILVIKFIFIQSIN